ncbi:four helix bundle protein [Simiduia sp. 21SJ11W-1]|uniref:four helix bundle protein n=1 Tax=Simiduia sp. 21SJ11W-1 TaxID=2909669 RepID=UPI00209CE302|nr:four helix bundle protein [Simiduia sp. 21SJ11W-1]UTA49532.1 four helix bundle protein [Simiduia sp. 21SJ11W-1]
MKFETLEVWKRSANLASQVYVELAQLKDYGFKDQITRSCLSISSNIAEGWERDSSKEKCRFLNIAKGSAAEFISQTYIGRKIKYIPGDAGKHWQQEAKEIAAMIASLSMKLDH